jgi:ABC-type nitrate/sulfonate/bicarbonate transport system permease component
MAVLLIVLGYAVAFILGFVFGALLGQRRSDDD